MTWRAARWSLVLGVAAAAGALGCIPDVVPTPGAGGAGGGAAGCTAGDVRCSDNTPESCNKLGVWESQPPCAAETPLCRAGACVQPPSCNGVKRSCGPSDDESCCTSPAIAGGTFERGDTEPLTPATVSSFRLDRFEVTVERFRAFVDAYEQSKPSAGAGAHPRIAGSGWSASWDDKLPADRAALITALQTDPAGPTWSETAGDDDHLPINCVSFYVAFAFCAWDGGRLPTEAEWNYAAAGGDEQRTYPWGEDAPDGSFVVYDCQGDGMCTFDDLFEVGSRSPKGDGRWGQADLAGSMFEWNLDVYGPYPAQCDDCATLGDTGNRVIRGGTWLTEQEPGSAEHLKANGRHGRDPIDTRADVGFRCARPL